MTLQLSVAHWHLQLSVAHWQQLRHHAEETYPEECCGLLLGTRFPDSAEVIVSEVWPVKNAWHDALLSSGKWVEPHFFEDQATDQGQAAEPTRTRGQGWHDRGDRYWIDPRDMLAAQRYGRDRQLQVVGVYHSHPDHAATPSECDRTLAWAEYVYLILSVGQGTVADGLAWMLDEQRQFQATPLRLQGSEALGEGAIAP